MITGLHTSRISIKAWVVGCNYDGFGFLTVMNLPGAVYIIEKHEAIFELNDKKKPNIVRQLTANDYSLDNTPLLSFPSFKFTEPLICCLTLPNRWANLSTRL
jgi:hypothetical protein